MADQTHNTPSGTFLEKRENVADYIHAKVLAMGNDRMAILINPTEYGYYVEAFEVGLP